MGRDLCMIPFLFRCLRILFRQLFALLLHSLFAAGSLLGGFNRFKCPNISALRGGGQPPGQLYRSSGLHWFRRSGERIGRSLDCGRSW